ncbi:hypothetical protein IJ114_01380 [Candidatus Saccharibacteria bacterium]|nr:hypothetical protein [Candidatus Saccharibacteria bacterium]
MLRKVVVFGDKRGKDIIGDMIENELPVEVIKVDDIGNNAKGDASESEIRERAIAALTPYMGKVDVVVLANADVMLAAEDSLKRMWPKQRIVGYGKNLPNIFRNENAVRILAPNIVKRMTKYRKIKIDYPNVDISERCLKNYSESEIAKNLGDFRGGTVVLCAVDLIRVKREIQEKVKWRATVVDMRESMLRDVCLALGLKGLDGRRTRELEG